MQYAKPVTLNVEECDRLSFLPYLFGNDFLYAEAYVYALAQKMMPEYQGGFWHFIRLPDGGGYMMPDGDRFHLVNGENWFDRTVSADAAGIILTSLVINRQLWLYQSCWAYRDTYVTQSADKGTCQTYTDNPACTLVSHQCAFYSEEGACLHEYATYSCESKTSGKVMVCGGDVFCLDGECDKAQSGKSNDFAEAVSQLAALAAAGKDVAALNGVDVRAFTGQAKFCKKAAAGYSNCCKDSGWGQDIGLAKCSSDEKALAKAKSNKLTVSVGEFCSKKVLGVCLEKKRSYCQFDSKLAQISGLETCRLAGLVMTVLTVGLVSCAGKLLSRFWPGDFFPTFYACHLAVLGVLAL